MKRFILFVKVLFLGFNHSHGQDGSDKTCGAIDTELDVKDRTFVGYTGTFSDCKVKCMARTDCTHYVWKNYGPHWSQCWIATRAMLGVERDFPMFTGPSVCPEEHDYMDYCIHEDAKYVRGWYVAITINALQCQLQCYRSNKNRGIKYVAFTYHHSSGGCYCIKNNRFEISKIKGYTSGDVDCDKCIQYSNRDLSVLSYVDGFGPDRYVTKDTPQKCQKSCKENPLCTFFEFHEDKKKCFHKNEANLLKKADNVNYSPRLCHIVTVNVGTLYKGQQKEYKLKCGENGIAKCHLESVSATFIGSVELFGMDTAFYPSNFCFGFRTTTRRFQDCDMWETEDIYRARVILKALNESTNVILKVIGQNLKTIEIGGWPKQYGL